MFEAAARHLNFTRAADELGVTTTAVGQRVRDLELRLGIKLFHRHGPRLSATEAGIALGGKVAEALTLIRRGIADCTEAVEPLRVTCVPTFANRWLIPRLSNFHRHFGPAPIVLDVSTNLQTHDSFDVAIRSGTGPWPELEAFALLPLEVTPMVSLENAMLLTDDPGSLLELPLLPDDQWWEWFGRVGISEPKLRFSATEFPTQEVDAIAAMNGDGAALLSPALFTDMLQSGALIAPFSTVWRGAESYWVLWKKKGPWNKFVEWLKAETMSARAGYEVVG